MSENSYTSMFLYDKVINMSRKNPLQQTWGKFSFSSSMVLVLLLALGIALKYISTDQNGFWWNIVDTIASGCLTASLIDIILRFSSERQYIEDGISIILKHIDKQNNSLVISSKMLGWNRDVSAKSLINAQLSKDEIERSISSFSESLNQYVDFCTDSAVFIQKYKRDVRLSKGKIDGCIQVMTETDLIILNLSEQPYIFTSNPQFRNGTVSGDTFEVLDVEVNGQKITDRLQNAIAQEPLVPGYRHAEFSIGKGYQIPISSKTACHIYMKTSYQISPSMFYQAKCFDLPCKSFELTAALDESLMHGSREYIIRWSLYRSEIKLFGKTNMNGENVTYNDNSFLHITNIEWMKPGNGYALTLSEKLCESNIRSSSQQYSLVH